MSGAIRKVKRGAIRQQTKTYLCNKQPHPSHHAAKLHFWWFPWIEGLCKLKEKIIKTCLGLNGYIQCSILKLLH